MNERWWKDPVEGRRVARWSFIGICALGGYAAVGPLGGLVAFVALLGIFAAAFFEARGSLFFLQFAHLRPPERRRIPPWLLWLGMLLGGVALVVAGTWLGGIAHDRLSAGVGDVIGGASVAGAGALFFAGLFTLLGYWVDKELAGWIERQGEEEMPEQYRDKPRRGRRRGGDVS